MAALTDAQLVTYKDDINANTDQEVIDALVANNNSVISDFYNQESVPIVWLLRQDVTADQMIAAMDWPTDYDTGFKDDIPGLSLLLANEGRIYNASSVGSRDALNSIFAGASNSKAGILLVSTRKGSFLEALYKITATGPGGGDGTSQAGSAIAEVVGDSTVQNVRDALAS